MICFLDQFNKHDHDGDEMPNFCLMWSESGNLHVVPLRPNEDDDPSGCPLVIDEEQEPFILDKSGYVQDETNPPLIGELALGCFGDENGTMVVENAVTVNLPVTISGGGINQILNPDGELNVDLVEEYAELLYDLMEITAAATPDDPPEK